MATLRSIGSGSGKNDMRVRLEGFDELQKRLANFPNRLRRNIMRGAMRSALTVLAKGIRGRTPKRTGLLRSSIRQSVRLFADGRMTGRVAIGGAKIGAKFKKGGASGAFHANLIEHGTKPHVIAPERGKALKTGINRFAAYAFHPGTRAVGMVARTRAADLGRATDAFRRYVDTRVVKEIEG